MSASGSADSRCLLLGLSHDELGVVVDGLADPLQPVVAVALGSTCLGLRTPLLAALAVLKERHERAKAMCEKVSEMYSYPVARGFAVVRETDKLDCVRCRLTVDDMATFGMILRTNGLPKLKQINLSGNYFGDPGMQALFESMGQGSLPLLTEMGLGGARALSGPGSAEALAAALHRGALPSLEFLAMSDSSLGDIGAAALAAALRKHPAIRTVCLGGCKISDECVASLLANLGKDDFKNLKKLYLDDDNLITDHGCAALTTSIKAGAFPAIDFVKVPRRRCSAEATDAIAQAIAARN